MTNYICSVIMPTYNTKEEYLRAAIESILTQTEKEFEFIIIDDGSTGDDFYIVSSYNDKRIRLYRNITNKGLPFTLNKAISLSKGRYIVRMDSDDISLANRLEIMISFMEKNLHVDVAGSGKINFGQNHKKCLMPLTNNEIRSTLLFQCPFVHPSVVFRNSSVNKFNIKYNNEEKAEDYNLWFECSKNKELIFANINKYLLKYRVHDSQISKNSNNIYLSTNNIINNMLEYFKVNLTKNEIDLYLKFCFASSIISFEDLLYLDNILIKIVNSLLNDTRFDINILKIIFGNKYSKECIRQFIIYNNYNGIAYYKSKIAVYSNLPISYKIVLKYIYLTNKLKYM